MRKIDCCLRYEVQPQSQLVELRTLHATSILPSKHYESDETLFPGPMKEERNTSILDVMTNDV